VEKAEKISSVRAQALKAPSPTCPARRTCGYCHLLCVSRNALFKHLRTCEGIKAVPGNETVAEPPALKLAIDTFSVAVEFPAPVVAVQESGRVKPSFGADNFEPGVVPTEAVIEDAAPQHTAASMSSVPTAQREPEQAHERDVTPFVPNFYKARQPEPEPGDRTVGIHQPFEAIQTVAGIGLRFRTKLEYWEAYIRTRSPYEVMMRRRRALSKPRTRRQYCSPSRPPDVKQKAHLFRGNVGRSYPSLQWDLNGELRQSTLYLDSRSEWRR
jgi:hypothetical protein